MSHKHDEPVPALEKVIAGLAELEVVLGTQVRPVISAVRATLVGAMAARDRGDVPAAMQRIGDAMDRLTRLADTLDPGEAALMRALAQNFRAALARGDEAHAKRDAAVMLQKSGAVERKKP